MILVKGLTRDKVMEVLDVDKATVARLRTRELLHSQKNKKGIWRYSQESVENLRLTFGEVRMTQAIESHLLEKENKMKIITQKIKLRFCLKHRRGTITKAKLAEGYCSKCGQLGRMREYVVEWALRPQVKNLNEL